MKSVGLILLCCVLFVHMGMGDAVSKVVRRGLSLFRCVKCTTFWVILAYTVFFTAADPVLCTALAFMCSYIALWIDLAFSKIAVWYEKWYKGVATEEHCNSTGENKTDKG